MNRKFRFTLTAFVASLFIYACNPAATSGDTATSATEETIETVEGGLRIAYVDNDSLLSKYDMFIDLRNDYEKKATIAQKELETRGRSLERKMASAQEKIDKGLVTRADAMALQQKLQQDQQSLMAYRDKIMAEISEDEQVMSNRLYHSVNDYMKKYNETAKYDLILNKNAATNTIMIGSPKLDITTAILEGLNKEYATSKKEEEKEKK